MGSGHNQDILSAAYIANTAVIRVEGRGSFKISPPLKQFIHQVINQQSAQRIFVDMSDCIGMDSTFMGVLAGISCYIKRKPDVVFKLINLSEKNEKLLTTLGVDRVVDYSRSSSTDEQQILTELEQEAHALEADFTDQLNAAKVTLEAHETLVNINPDNYSKFKSVLELLQNDVDTLDPE
jgi:anti-sigma B factor antagonist